MFGEARISSLVVSALAGVGLTLFLNTALRDLGSALAISVPVTLAMGALMFLFASDSMKKGGDAPPDSKANKGE